MILAFLSSLVSPVVGAFTKHQEVKAKKQERADRVEETKVNAQIKRIENGDTNAAKLDEISLSNRGWKDDYLLLLTTFPIILSFIPDYAHYVELGFAALESVPEYYWYGLAMVYIDTFGFRRMLRVAVEHWLSKKYGVNNG